ncbi:hypothetical protein Trydic_g14147 [Trypoxylus dichotomus]
MFSLIQAAILAVFLVLAKAIPIDEHDLISATSYSSGSLGYSGGHEELGDFGGLELGGFDGEDHSYHVEAPVVTQHVVSPIIKNVPILYNHEDEHEEEHYEPKKYEFHYAVEDKHTGDIKSQKESGDGHVVKGEYSLKEADGTTRIVKYSADKKSGFNAVVIRKGHAVHPQVEHKDVEVKKVVVPIASHHDDDYGHLFSHY